MLPENIIWVVVPINIFLYYQYIKSIVFGGTKPNLVSWVIWAVAPLLATLFQIQAGATLSVLPVFLAGFGPVFVVFFAIFTKRSHWKLTTLDLICGALSTLSLVLYITTHNLSISILFAILSDGLAAIPTIVKGWKFPETESPGPYFAGLFGNTLGLFVIQHWIFTIYSFGIYNSLINITLLIPIYRKKIFKKF